MSKRHSDALAIQQGACNPSGIAHSIVAACQEIMAEPEHTGTMRVRQDPALRLMVHQLAYLCDVRSIDDDYQVYPTLQKECELQVEADKAKAQADAAVQAAHAELHFGPAC